MWVYLLTFTSVKVLLWTRTYAPPTSAAGMHALGCQVKQASSGLVYQ